MLHTDFKCDYVCGRYVFRQNEILSYLVLTGFGSERTNMAHFYFCNGAACHVHLDCLCVVFLLFHRFGFAVSLGRL